MSNTEPAEFYLNTPEADQMVKYAQLLKDGPGPMAPIMGIDWSKPVETMAGNSAHIYAIDYSLEKPVIGRLDKEGFQTEIRAWYLNGLAYKDGACPSLNLRNVPEGK